MGPGKVDYQLKADSKSSRLLMGAVGYPMRALASMWAARLRLEPDGRWGHLAVPLLGTHQPGFVPNCPDTQTPPLYAGA